MVIDVSKNQVLITADPNIYPLEAIYGAAYVFLNRAYVFLEKNKEEKILISMKARQKMNRKQLGDLSGEFNNELLSYSLRNEISKNNKKIREYIVGRALIGALGKDNGGEDVDEYIEEDIEEWTGDDLGISVPWEKQFKKTKKESK